MNWYKATGPGGTAMFGTGTWNLPADDGPGEWMPYLHGQIIPCVYGYHVTDAAHIAAWIGPEVEIYLAEVDPGGILVPGQDGDKWATPTARLTNRLHWDEQISLQFIEDCDKHVGGIYAPELKRDAQQSVISPGSSRWNEVDAFIVACQATFARSFGDTWASQRQAEREERLWQNQRVLMYLHGGIA